MLIKKAGDFVMTKEKYALMTIAAGVVLVIASALLMIFSGPKETPWELTETLLPGEVQTAYIWSEKLNTSSLNLSQDELVQAIQLMNKLEKHDFTENSSHPIYEPKYGLVIRYGSSELTFTEIGGSQIELVFDEGTAISLDTSDWVVENAALADFIRSMSGYSE